MTWTTMESFNITWRNPKNVCFFGRDLTTCQKKNKTHILPVGVFQYLPVLELFQLYYLPQYNYDNLWTTPYLSWNHLEKSACQLSYFFFFSLMTLLYNSPVYICFIYVENTTKNTIAPCSISQCLQDRCALIQIDRRFKATEQKFKFYIDDYY